MCADAGSLGLAHSKFKLMTGSLEGRSVQMTMYVENEEERQLWDLGRGGEFLIFFPNLFFISKLGNVAQPSL